MAEYRGYTVGSDGHFVRCEPIVCDTDEEAVERAKRMPDGRNIEVWCGDRMVAKVTAKGTGAVTHEIKDGCLKPKK
jgi:hypothetical protein